MSDENPLGTRVQLLVHKMKDAVHTRRRLPGTLMNINFFLFSLVLIALVGLISKKTNLYVQQTFLVDFSAVVFARLQRETSMNFLGPVYKKLGDPR